MTRVLLFAAAGLGIGALTATAQTPAPAPAAVASTQPSATGLILVEVAFGADGKVAACRIVRSNAPFPLEASTVDYIERQWSNEALSGLTVDFPITFDESPSYATHWIEGLAPPPNFLPTGDPGRTVKLRITFGADGWVDRVKVVQPSGIQLVDQGTAHWVMVHWHDDAYAGKTFDAPLIFQTPVAPAPVVVAKKPEPKKKPAPPEEPSSPPAVRVE